MCENGMTGPNHLDRAESRFVRIPKSISVLSTCPVPLFFAIYYGKINRLCMCRKLSND